MLVHLIGVSGTGMAALAVLFREAGHTVSGSDVSFAPPMGPVLEAAGVQCKQGYAPEHIPEGVDLVVVGNVIRRDNPEAVAAEARGVPRLSMSGALREHFLVRRKPLVVCGTHGKTTTTTMALTILRTAELEPGWFVGGVPKGAPPSALGARGIRLASRAQLLPGFSGTGPSPFVLEGDEYDAVYWQKTPKFLDYVGVSDEDVAIVTSVEHDHVDIYPSAEAYEGAFRALLQKLPEGGLVVADARDARLRPLVEREARCRVAFYALEGDDTGSVTPTWVAAPGAIDDQGLQHFDAFAGGMSLGRFTVGAPGAHNVRNALGAMAACAEGFGVPTTTARRALATFTGVRRRQDLLGSPGGVLVYDDFAHHPTAVDETLRALRAKHPSARLWAVFEPRSATACRALHQDAYARAFESAHRVVLAPLGRANIPDGERLDLAKLGAALGAKATLAPDLASIVELVVAEAREGDVVALLSNGAFGGLPHEIVTRLSAKNPGEAP